jgi:hypothetical protein
MTGYRRSLEMHPLEAHRFYGVYAACVVVGALFVALWPELVSLNLAVQVRNAFMLPIVLGLLIALAVKALPGRQRLRGTYRWILAALVTLTCALGVFGGLSGAG